MLDKENEKYHMLQETGKLPPRRLDNGKPQLTLTEKKNRKNAKKIKKSQKGVMGANNLFFQQEERDIYEYVWHELKDEVVKRKGELTFIDKQLINDGCIARIRLYRKTRMESSFNKFFDRLVTQDPMAQFQSVLKSLGLLNDKNKDSNSNKDLISKLLSEESNAEIESKHKTIDDWREAQDDEEIKLQLFTPKNVSMFNREFADEEESVEDKLSELSN